VLAAWGGIEPPTSSGNLPWYPSSSWSESWVWFTVLSHISPHDSIQRYNKKDVSTYHSNGKKV